MLKILKYTQALVLLILTTFVPLTAWSNPTTQSQDKILDYNKCINKHINDVVSLEQDILRAATIIQEVLCQSEAEQAQAHYVTRGNYDDLQAGNVIKQITRGRVYQMRLRQIRNSVIPVD